MGNQRIKENTTKVSFSRPFIMHLGNWGPQKSSYLPKSLSVLENEQVPAAVCYRVFLSIFNVVY